MFQPTADQTSITATASKGVLRCDRCPLGDGRPFPVPARRSRRSPTTKYLGNWAGRYGGRLRARQSVLHRLGRLKMILHAEHAGVEELRRFQREAELLAKLRHREYRANPRDRRTAAALSFFSLEWKAARWTSTWRHLCRRVRLPSWCGNLPGRYRRPIRQASSIATSSLPTLLLLRQ